VNFEWDDAKALSNLNKHGVSFSEAKELFESGRDYLEIFDSAHSVSEDRFIAIGEIRRGVAVVVFTERDDDVIRIIGARFATSREKEKYSSYMDEQL
jgi:uncharacterized DUF497 family protein